MNVFELMAKIGLDDSEFTAKLSGAVGKISGVGKTIAKIGGVAMAAGSAAMTALGKSAVDAGMSFDQSMSQVAATMGKTVDEIAQLRDFAQEMGATTAFSATQAADALNYMALAGYDAETSMKMLPNVLDLAAAGGMALSDASDMITDSQSALGLSLDDTSELVDKMAQAASKSNTSVSQLGEAILTVGGTAKNLKGGTTELTAILGMLADNGVKGAEGGTALRNILNSLTAPTTEAAKLLKKMGLEVYDSTGNMRSLNDVFLDMRDAMDSMSQQDRMNVISTIFNARDMKSAEAILANVGDRYEELSGYIDDAAGAAEKMAETQLDNLAGDITMFQSALEGAKITVSDVLTPSLREFVQFGTSSVSALSDAFKEGGLSGAMEAFGSILSDGLSMLISKAPQFIDAGMKLIGALGNGLLENSDLIITSAIEIGQILINGIITAVPAAAGAAAQLITEIAVSFTEQMPTLVPEIVGALGIVADAFLNPDFLGAMLDAGLEIITYLGQGLIDNADTLITKAIELAGFLVNGLLEALPQVLDIGVQVIAAFVTGIAEHLPEITPAAVQAIVTLVQTLISPDSLTLIINAALQLLMGLANGLIEALPILIEALPEIIRTIVTVLLDSIPTILETAGQLIDALTTGLIDAIPMLIGMLPQITMAIAAALIKAAPDLLVAAVELITQLSFGLIKNIPILLLAIPEIILEIIKGLARGGADMFMAGEDLLISVKDGFFSLIDNAVNWGKDLIDNFIGGIKEKAGSVVDTVEDIAGDIADFIGFSEPKKGPLSPAGGHPFHTYAPDMMDLFIKGVKDNENALRRQIASSFDLEADIKESAYSEPQGAPMGGIPLGYGSLQSTSERQPIYLQVGEEVFAKLVYNANIREGERVGVNLTEAVRV